MSAGKHNIIIDQGSDFAIQLIIKENDVVKDITGYSARAEMRADKTSTATVEATFTCTITNPTGGALKMELSNSITKNITPAIYFYDLELFTVADAAVSRLLEGSVTVTPEITR